MLASLISDRKVRFDVPVRLRIGDQRHGDFGYRGRHGASACPLTNVRSQCPLWVKSRHRRCQFSCPLYPQKRTLLGDSRMSDQLVHERFAAELDAIDGAHRLGLARIPPRLPLSVREPSAVFCCAGDGHSGELNTKPAGGLTMR